MVTKPADDFGDGNVHTLPVPDAAAIRRHLDRLFDRCSAEYPGGRCEIAWSIAGAWAITGAETFPTTTEGLEGAVACAVEHNRRRSNVYVGVNPRHPHVSPVGRCSADDVEIAFFQFTECDKPESLALVQHPPLPFSFVVVTGNAPNKRPHCYYELAEPLRDMVLWRSRQEALRDHFKGDNVVDPPRIMRLAGTVNYPAPHKAGRGYLAEIVELYPRKTRRAPVTGEALAEAYGLAGPDAASSASGTGTGETPNFNEGRYDAAAAIEEIRACRPQGDEWHNKVLVLVGHLVARGVPAAVIMAMAEHLTVAPWPLSDTVKQITKALDGAYKKDYGPKDTEETEFTAELPPTPEQLTRTTADDWVGREVAAPDFLLGELLATTSRMMLMAPTGLGKTNFALGAALAITAEQKSFLHWRVPRPARVLYIDGEMSERLMRSRLDDAIRRVGGVVPKTLRILSRLADFSDLPPLNTKAGQDYVDRFVAGTGGTDLILFDNIQALLVGDMKDEAVWQPMLPWIWELTRRAIGQVWIHHTNDEGKSYGTKTREWQLDTVAAMEAIERPEADIAFALRFTKARERAPDNRTDFDPVIVTLTDDRWVFERGGCAPRRYTAEDRALDLLQDAIAREGVVPPASAYIPASTLCVTEGLWRNYCYAGCISDGDPDPTRKAEADRKAFQRAAGKLIGGRVGKWDLWVWIIK
jgi:hypothetical protein